MYKIRRTQEGVELFDGFNYFERVNFSMTTWYIIKAIKKHGKDGAVSKVIKLFDIDEKNAREDIKTVLTNLNTLNIDMDKIPEKLTRTKYAPRTVHFDITPRCNSNCIYCIASERMKHPEELTTDQIINVVNQLPDMGTWLLTLSGGEPTLRKDFFQILDRVEKIKLLTQVFTNGTQITKEFANKFSKYKYAFAQVSIDSYKPEHHDFNRGVKGMHKRAVRGLKNLFDSGLTPEVCMVITRKNLYDIDKTAEFFYDMGVKYVRIGPAHPYSGKGFDNKEELSLTSDQLKIIGEKLISLNKKYAGEMEFYPTRHFVVYTVDPPKHKLHRCGNGRTVLYIKPNGFVYPCIFMVYPKFKIGDVKKDRIEDIWNNSNLLKRIRYFDKNKVEKCSKCEARDLCSGGCRSSSLYHHGSIFEYDPYFCALFNVK